MPTARLIIQQPGQRARVAEAAAPVVSVGRRPDNAVCLEDSNVSKYHAVIERRGDGYVVTDLGSSNGTTVNGERLTAPRPLQDGDLICLGGDSTIEFRLEAEPGASEGGAAPPPTPSLNLPSASGLTPSVSPPSMPSVRAPSLPSVHAPSVNMPRAPSVHAPSAPSVNVPSAPSVHVPSVRAPSVPSVQTPAAVQRILGMPRALFAAVSATLLGGAVLAALWGAGLVGPKPAHNPDDLTADPFEQLDAKDDSPKGDSKSGAAETPAQQEQAAASNTETAAPPAPPAGAATNAAGADAVAPLARALAAQISQKSGYAFDPRFVDQIKTYMNDYKSAANYYERASKYREPIEREFSNTQGIQPLVPYLLAMSQTKFVERGAGGVWNLPPALLAQYAGAGDTADPAVSTRAAAAYTRALLDTFDREDFMYAVACYGMSVDDAGKLRVALEEKDPGRRLRGDFWKMKAAGLLQGAQVERVARFFAAGIVFENPSQFGLKGEPLSTLY